jgi:hypothetical protein
MVAKKTGAGKSSKKLDSFNRSQQIHQVLEKGIIESEALLNSAADRPDDDAHIVDLLASTSGEQGVRLSSKQAKQPARKSSKPSKPKKSKGKKR